MAPLSDDLSFTAGSRSPSHRGLSGMIHDSWSYIKDSWGSKEEVEKEAETVLLDEAPTEEEEEEEAEETLTPTIGYGVNSFHQSLEPILPEEESGKSIKVYLYSTGEYKEDGEPPPAKMIEVCIDEMVEHVKVHRVVIRGNTKTKARVIESVLHRRGSLNNATTQVQIIKAISSALRQFHYMGIFDSVRFHIREAGPTSDNLPETTSVEIIVEVDEARCDAELSGAMWYTQPTDQSWALGCSLAKKNLLGLGEELCSRLIYSPYRWEVLASFFSPAFRGADARAFVRAQDWKEISSYKEQTCGIEYSIVASKHHNVFYDLGWRTLTDESQTASESIRRQLGHDLLSSLNYRFTLGRNEPFMTLTPGYSFDASTRIGGLAPGNWSSRFLRQEIDFLFRVPIGVAALNIGVYGGVIFPWGNDFLKKPTSLPERFFLGGDRCSLPTGGGLWGFQTRGIGPSEPRRHVKDISNGKNSESCGRDFVGGDLAVSAFAHMSFGLPFRWLREQGAYGHVFACSGNVTKLAENEFRDFSFKGFVNAFRTSVGFGIVIPIDGAARLQCNYIYTVNQSKHDAGKAGFQISFSSSIT